LEQLNKKYCYSVFFLFQADRILLDGGYMNLIPRYIFNNSFDDIFDFSVARNNNFMKADIIKKEGNYVFEIDIPGFRKEDINIDYNKGYLTVKVKKEDNNDDLNNKEYIRKERFYGEYQRSFYVGDVDDSKITASYVNGILNITIPIESDSRKNQKTIEIQ
jgi:HSP20 family protein